MNASSVDQRLSQLDTVGTHFHHVELVGGGGWHPQLQLLSDFVVFTRRQVAKPVKCETCLHSLQIGS